MSDGAPVTVEHVLGDPAAPVTVLEYADYECPYCAALGPVLRELVETSDGQVRLVFRNYPLADVHPYALTAALAAEASAPHGVFWPMHDLLLARQDRLTDADLAAYAEELGVDGRLVVGEAAQPFGDVVEADFAAGVEAGVPGTPTLFIDDVRFKGALDLTALRAATNSPAGSGGSADRPRLAPRSWWQRR